MVILALDFGDCRIGVAVTDPSHKIALGLPTIQTDTCGEEIDKIKNLAVERNVTKIVIGLPKHKDGTQGQMARKTRGFVKKLKRQLPDVEFIFVDERYTSVRANRALTAMKANRSERKEKVDRLSAQFILTRYLNKT